MAYALELDDATVFPYLLTIELSREGRLKLFTALSLLRDHGDAFMNDPKRRLAPGSECFLFDYVLNDKHGDGRVRHFRFIVDDAAAQYGVLRIVYMDERS